MGRMLLLSLLLSFLILTSACTSEDREAVNTENETDRKAFKVVQPPYNTDLPGEEGIKNVINAYNYSVINAQLADPYFKVLRKYATNDETQRVFINAGFDTQQGIAMRSWIKKFIFENISVSEKSAFVDTSEIWNYDYIDIKTKEVAEPKKEMRYKLKYALVKEEGRWVVSEITENEPTVVVESFATQPTKNGSFK